MTNEDYIIELQRERIKALEKEVASLRAKVPKFEIGQEVWFLELMWDKYVIHKDCVASIEIYPNKITYCLYNRVAPDEKCLFATERQAKNQKKKLEKEWNNVH